MTVTRPALLSLALCGALLGCEGSGPGAADAWIPDQMVGEGLRFLDMVPSEWGPVADGAAKNDLPGKQDSGPYDPNDRDGDKLTNAQEAQLGTNPDSKDTDGDGIDDKTEVGDPSKPKDQDGDGKWDAKEPDTFDSDMDKIPDSKDKNDLDGPCSPKGSKGPQRLFYNTTVNKSMKLTRACSPYKVIGFLWMTAGATLSSEPGVQVRFGAGAALKLGNNSTKGSLALQGTVAEPVLLTADTATPGSGFWRGVMAENGGTISLKQCNLLWAGGVTTSVGEPQAALWVKSASKIGLQGCKLNSSAGFGLHATLALKGSKLFSAFSGNNLGGNKASAALNIAHLAEIGGGNDFGKSGAGGEVKVSSGYVEASGFWKSIGVPYIFLASTVELRAKITIEAGANLVFESTNADAELLIYNSKGSLEALGSPQSPIIFRSSKGTAGSWKGLMFTIGSSTLKNVRIVGGGMTNYQSQNSGLYVGKDAALSATGVVIKDSSGDGVYLYRYSNGCSKASLSSFAFEGTIAKCKVYCVDDTNGGKCIKP